MTRDEVISRLRSLKPRLSAEGIAHLYLFGSVLRDEAGPASDVDLFFDPRCPLSLVEYVRLKDVTESLMGERVDLIERSSLHPRLRSGIEAEALRIF